ncbi:MAG TPA: type II toxin-antitoxin system VapC family toxin [Bryobacteraceae bacterium]|nr:type II toxin-antitoxin system VapC family toxin [Bryobacteraceae bacterium]
MIDPASGPFLFDTSAESYLGRPLSAAEAEWVVNYAALFPMYVAVLTVVERARGYYMVIGGAGPSRRVDVEQRMLQYVHSLEIRSRVLDLTVPIALTAAQLMTLCPYPPSPPRRSHEVSESRQDRLARWRFDVMIAATALVHNLPLIHNNPQDFETLRAVIERVPERFPGAGPLNLISVKRLVA